MIHTKRILVPTGFSDYAKELILYAAGAAKAFDAELIIASVINVRDVDAVSRITSFGYEVDGEHYVEKIIEERKKLLQHITQSCEIPQDKIRTLFIVGNPVRELLQVTVEEKIDLVIMGTKGRTNLKSVFVGSVAEKMFRKSPVTVVSYRSKAESEVLRKHIKTIV